MAVKRRSTGSKERNSKKPEAVSPDALTLTFRKVGGGYNLTVAGTVGDVQPNGWTSIPFSWIYPSRTHLQAPVAGFFRVETSQFRGDFRVLEARPLPRKVSKKAAKKAR